MFAPRISLLQYSGKEPSRQHRETTWSLDIQCVKIHKDKHCAGRDHAFPVHSFANALVTPMMRVI